jgi:hypothetical protein
LVVECFFFPEVEYSLDMAAFRGENLRMRALQVFPTGLKTWLRLTFTSSIALCILPLAFAQTNDGNDDKSWTSNSQGQSTSGNTNPTRTQESHVVENGHVVDKESTERLGPDGRYEPYQDVEKESVKVDANTTRTINRTFVRDSDGRKTLMQVTDQETHMLPGGGQKSTLTTSNPDANGQLQVVQKEIQDTKQISSDIKETKTTVLTPSGNGGLAPSIQREERETKRNDHLTEFKKSTSLPDTNGNWVVNEVKEGAIRSDGKNQTREESVLRPDNDGRMAVVERTVRKESESTPGNKQQTTETYSTDVPGGFGEGRLNLSQRVNTVQSVSADGKQITQTQIDARNPGEPGGGLRPTEKTIDIVRPGADGKNQEQHTIQTVDPSGSMGVVSVDTRQVSTSPVVQVDTKKPAAVPAVKAKPGDAAKPK